MPADAPPPEEDDDPPGVPEWVVTYGDMMSLLLTFFIMLVSLSEIQDEKRYRDVLASVHARLGYATSAPAAPGERPAGNAELSGPKTAGRPTPAAPGDGGTPRPTAPGPRARLSRDPGGRPVSAGPAVAFAPGGAEFVAGATVILDDLAATLAGKPQKIAVTGFAPGGPASAHARARRVMAELVARGVREGRFRLRTDSSDSPATETVGSVSESAPPVDRAEVWVLDVLATDPRPGG